MNGPTTVEPTPIEARARRVYQAIAARVADAPPATGRPVSEEIILQEAERELGALAAEQEQSMGVLAATLDERKRQADEQALVNAALNAALAEARSRATQVGPVTGTAEQWKARLATMPPLASHEIESWMQTATRRLAHIGTTQADVMIVRMANLLLLPYQAPPSANAETT